MKLNFVCAAALAGAMALASCETTGGGYGAPRTQLSQCMRNALVGAGIGAIAGAAIGDSDNRVENAAIGAAVVGGGTYGVCRYLNAREQQRVENAYHQSLNSGQAVNENWRSDQGAPRSLQVSSPGPAPGRGPECRRVSATVSDPQYGNQQLPPETFCRAPGGQWVPA
ncbi:MAG: glycine zipper 2TM domain-containing protein [Phycisphaerales bacterium]|nr:glycine zipper 2TM domain-containing protein [Hyphomonadaceae bacterium]